ncbi:methylated-DNA--[protein]-cysteine S-methyltransferase [Flavobacteriaceae bacterium 3-367]
MTVQKQIDYNRIAKAIDYLKANFKKQPGLEELAEIVHLSPFHFQRLFTEWAGVSPKKFIQYTSIEYAKQLLRKKQATLFDAAMETGLSGTSRLHDLFVNIEGMTPGEYKNGGKNLAINYSYAESPFGNLIVASTSKGICHMAFTTDQEEAFNHLRARFPNAQYDRVVDKIQQDALFVFQHGPDKLNQIKLHLNGTPFQVKVWETLLKIPMGELRSYGTIAKLVENPQAARAIGSAIGQNPVAYLIPCHRVIKSTGEIGGYMWGNTRKTAIIGWEAAKVAV